MTNRSNENEPDVQSAKAAIAVPRESALSLDRTIGVASERARKHRQLSKRRDLGREESFCSSIGGSLMGFEDHLHRRQSNDGDGDNNNEDESDAERGFCGKLRKALIPQKKDATDDLFPQITAAVMTVRILVLIVLISTALVVTAGTFYYGHNNNTNDAKVAFENAFYAAVTNMRTQLPDQLARQLSVLDALAADVSIQHQELGSSSSWPLGNGVTQAYWESQVHRLRTLGENHLKSVLLLPKVSDAELLDWEYRVQHNEKLGINWLLNSVDYQARQGVEPKILQEMSVTLYDDISAMVSPVLLTPTGEARETGAGPYFCLWQSSPAVIRMVSNATMPNASSTIASPPVYNRNLFSSNMSADVARLLQQGDAVMVEGEPDQLMDILVRGWNQTSYTTGQNGHAYQPTSHYSILLYPLLVPDNGATNSDTLVGSVAGILDWKDLLKLPATLQPKLEATTKSSSNSWPFANDNSVPASPLEEDKKTSLVCVLEHVQAYNDTNSSSNAVEKKLYSFQVFDDPTRESVFLGSFDAHDDVYDGWLAAEIQWGEVTNGIWYQLTAASAAQDVSLLSGTIDRPGNGSAPTPFSSQYSLRLYPAMEMEAYYSSSSAHGSRSGRPSLFLAFIAVVVFFCVLLFGIYDRLVEHRNGLLHRQAVQSTAIVSSLFPETVRDRLMQQNEPNSNYDSENQMSATWSEPQLASTASQVGDTSRGAVESSDSHDLKRPVGLTEQIPLTEVSENSESSDTGRGYVKEPAKLRLKNILATEATRPTPRRKSTGTPSSAPSQYSTHATPTIDSNDKPIADFFPKCTVLFADIVGFTAWSSQREPTQVFTLLQSLYAVFDKAAKKRGVFKVETIGDSYVAVTGLPEPQEDHAERMAGFALDCRVRMRDVTRKLERTLGPETGDLTMRFGLHSGPVTAGVLRGERSRFQLFGDTVNTAARMESTGRKNYIQVSESTARLLQQAGKSRWIVPREETVTVKGKGEMQTYWLEANSVKPRRKRSLQNGSSSVETSCYESVGLASAVSLLSDDSEIFTVREEEQTENRTLEKIRPQRALLATHSSMLWGRSQEVFETMPGPSRRIESSVLTRLVDWNVGMLLRVLKQVVARRRSLKSIGRRVLPMNSMDLRFAIRHETMKGKTTVDEVAEIIPIPKFDSEAAGVVQVDPETVDLGRVVEQQLANFVKAIASMYRDNPFHNFEHACHVQMSMWKLLQRVVSPEQVNYEGGAAAVASDAHKYTYGITSDPLTQFAVLFCALVHDVDHTGVTNGQLVKEKAHIATVYKNKSVAEQNSIDLAWDLLMENNYKDLRRCIYSDDDEFKRFRQLVVNIVLATDIFDKDLSALRKNRWEKAFTETPVDEPPTQSANRKATIVLEHLIQASDVSHTMQHWDIYTKWNERLFYEMYAAYKSGRTDSDPSQGWYKGELWFFDNYVIPLAKKLENCGVFGVCSHECLNYALENRAMWEKKGEEIVANMIQTDFFRKQSSNKILGNDASARKLPVDEKEKE